MKTINLIALASLWCGCLDSSSNTDIRRQALKSMGQNIIVPGYQDFDNKASELQKSIAVACDHKNQSGLENARLSWNETRSPWKKQSILAFGPFKDEPLRLGPKIDFWPTRPDSIEKLLASDRSAMEMNLSASTMGMPALEYVLFDVNALARIQNDGNVCHYLNAVSQKLTEHATAMLDAWAPDRGDYVGSLTQEGPYSDEFPDIHSALAEIVHRIGFTLEDIRKDKLGAPLGNSGDGSPQPFLAESPYSKRSLQDTLDALIGIESFFLGADDPVSLALSDIVATKAPDQTNQFKNLLNASRIAILSISRPLTEAVQISPDQVENGIEKLGELQTFIQVDIVGTLGLSTRFNDSDGD